MRATWVTDIHLNFLRPLALQAFYERVAAERPDVVLVSGDIGEAGSCVGFVEGIAAATRAPVYFVLGNHDYYRSSIRAVRDGVARLAGAARWLPAQPPLQLTPRTVTDVPQIMRVVSRARELGFATDDEEFVAGCRCVAVPLTTVAETGIAAAMSITMPKSRTAEGWQHALYGPLRDAAQAIRGGMGLQGALSP